MSARVSVGKCTPAETRKSSEKKVNLIFTLSSIDLGFLPSVELTIAYLNARSQNSRLIPGLSLYLSPDKFKSSLKIKFSLISILSLS